MGVKEASATYRVLGEVALAGEGVPMGYKITDVGVIPEDWDPVPLGALARGIFRGASPRPIDDPVWFDEASSVGWVRISDVTQSSRYLFDTTQRLSQRGVEKSRYLPSGALIMSICATVGRPIETRMEVCIHDGFVVFDRPAVDQDFLYHILSDLEPRWGSKGQTGSQMNLNTGLIKGTGVLVPRRKGEQKVIAEALSDADELIESLQQLIAKKRAVKQGAMQALLTGQERLLEFNGEWEVKRLDMLADIRSGGTPATGQPDFWNGEVPWCTPTDITALGGHKYLRKTARKITAKGLQASSAELIPAGSVVMTSRATIGECALNLVPVTTNQGFKNFVPFDDTDAEFLYYLLLMQTDGFISLCGGSTFLEISKKQLAAYQVSLPPSKDEQTAIATVLSDMDAEIDALEARLAKTRALKAGMMQALLTGRIRLPLDEAA